MITSIFIYILTLRLIDSPIKKYTSNSFGIFFTGLVVIPKLKPKGKNKTEINPNFSETEIVVNNSIYVVLIYE